MARCVLIDSVVIDIHCHLLPEVDDGPKSWDAAVEMCRMAAADGITHAVATAATPTIGMRTIARTFRGFSTNSAIKSVGSALATEPGLRTFIFLSRIWERVLEPATLFTIGETDYLLIELSNYSVPTRLSECFTRLGRIAG